MQDAGALKKVVADHVIDIPRTADERAEA